MDKHLSEITADLYMLFISKMTNETGGYICNYENKYRGRTPQNAGYMSIVQNVQIAIAPVHHMLLVCFRWLSHAKHRRAPKPILPGSSMFSSDSRLAASSSPEP